MQIICPKCTNSLQVDAVMATGKYFRVRCSRCEHRFEVDRLTGKPLSPGQPSAFGAGRTEPGTTRIGQRTGDVRTSSTARPAIAAGPQLDAFRSALSSRHERMMQQDEFALLGIDEGAGDVDVLHAYLRASEEWRPARYEGLLSDVEMHRVREIADRLERAYTEVGDLARRRRMVGGERRTGPVNPGGPKTGPFGMKPTPPSAPITSSASSFPKEASSATVFFAQGMDALKAGHFLEAREHFQHCVAIDPKRAEAHFRLGQAVLRISEGNGHTDWSKVEGCFAVALDIAPDSVEYLLGMAKLWQLRGQPSTAMRYFKRIRDLDADHMEANREIRLYLMRKKKDQKPGTTTAKFLGFLGRKE